MEFVHPHFGLHIDTDSCAELFLDLAKQYGRIPATKCLFCPGCDTVVAMCCKSFNPAMSLIEFVNVMRQISKWDLKEQQDLTIRCFESYVNPAVEKGCSLLDDKNLCSVYEARPTGCRFFGQYSKNSWEKRIKGAAKTLGMKISDLPMEGKQCRNIEVYSKQISIPPDVEESVFETVYNMDARLFDDPKFGKNLVDAAATYLPFDAHYLLYRIGADNLETLTAMRMKIDSARKKFESGELSEEELGAEEKKVQDFIDEVTKQIRTPKEENGDGEKS